MIMKMAPFHLHITQGVWFVYSPSLVAAYRKSSRSSSRYRGYPRLCHGTPQEEILQDCPLQGWAIAEYKATFCIYHDHFAQVCTFNYLNIVLLITDGQQADDSGGSSKRRGRSQQSPEKSSSRSPLRNTTQDINVRRDNSVEFREPLASYRYKHYIKMHSRIKKNDCSYLQCKNEISM